MIKGKTFSTRYQREAAVAATLLARPVNLRVPESARERSRPTDELPLLTDELREEIMAEIGGRE